MNKIVLSKFEKRIYSQNGEDGIIVKLAKEIYEDIYNKYYVEFGVGKHKGKKTSDNTTLLRKEYNWNGLLMGKSYPDPKINLQQELLTKENIVSLFEKYNVPKHFNFLSVDIDSNDFYILHKIVEEYTADIIIVEYNASHSPSEDKVIKYEMDDILGAHVYYGASLLSFYNLLTKFNYSLVYTERRGINAFFVHNNAIQEKNLDFVNINNVGKLYTKSFTEPNKRPDPKNREFISSDEAMK
jgi:hypothetical protein